MRSTAFLFALSLGTIALSGCTAEGESVDGTDQAGTAAQDLDVAQLRERAKTSTRYDLRDLGSVSANVSSRYSDCITRSAKKDDFSSRQTSLAFRGDGTNLEQIGDAGFNYVRPDLQPSTKDEVRGAILTQRAPNVPLVGDTITYDVIRSVAADSLGPAGLLIERVIVPTAERGHASDGLATQYGRAATNPDAFAVSYTFCPGEKHTIEAEGRTDWGLYEDCRDAKADATVTRGSFRAAITPDGGACSLTSYRGAAFGSRKNWIVEARLHDAAPFHLRLPGSWDDTSVVIRGRSLSISGTRKWLGEKVETKTFDYDVEKLTVEHEGNTIISVRVNDAVVARFEAISFQSVQGYGTFETLGAREVRATR